MMNESTHCWAFGSYMVAMPVEQANFLLLVISVKYLVSQNYYDHKVRILNLTVQ